MADLSSLSNAPETSYKTLPEPTTITSKTDLDVVQGAQTDPAPQGHPGPLLSDEDQEMIAEEGDVTSMLAKDSGFAVSCTAHNMETTSLGDGAAGSAITNIVSTPHHDSNLPTVAIAPSANQKPGGSSNENVFVDTRTPPLEIPAAVITESGHVEGTEDAENDASENEDDDMSSEVSEGVDLQEELQEALDESNFEFAGSFYHGSLLTNPPNPCLFISGLGLVGLPLSDRDAKSIISCATMAPFGHGERMVVNKDVRDTWEIEASRVSFGNAAWHNYINITLCAQLCSSLGINIGANPPKMELYKLLLYETGSHFLPHQDTQKADGMFATAIILLPSAYTGGQVIVSHASDSKTIDFAKDSLFSMALLAWYTDVKHEVKPVTSGYRLALSYNLIHVAPPGVPPPCLPDMRDTTYLLRRVLRKWRDDQYETSPNLMAYLLDHEYSSANLSKGLKALNGVDLHRVSFVRSIAEELGFRVGLALLEHNVSGQAEDGGYNYHRRSRYDRYYDEYSDEDEDDEETPDMLEVDSTSTTISGLVDLDGSTMLSVGKVIVKPEWLIPNDPFEDETPDEQEYEGYMGNYPGQVEHWYRRTALVLMHEDNVDDVCFSVEGAPYAFRMLKKSTTIPPTADDRRWAMRLLQAGYLRQEHVLCLLDFAIKWKDPAIWKAITNISTCTLAVVDSKILYKAMEIFSFDVVRLSFETLLARSNVLAERINFLAQLPSKAPASEKDAVHAWYQREVAKILSSYKPNNAQDIPTILTIIRLFGLKAFTTIVMPNVTKNKGNYAFCIAFMKSLTENQQTIIEQESSRITQQSTAPSPEDGNPSAPTPTTVDAVNTLIKQFLHAALSQWNDVAPAPYNYHHPYYAAPAMTNSSTKIDRVIEIIDHAIALSDLDVCRTLFIDLLKGPDTSAKKFQEIYIPLIPRLRTLFATKSLQISQPPFVDFIQLVIGLYLRDILGKKGQLSNMNLRKIGCGCSDCKMLDEFIFDYSRSTTTIRVVQARRKHLESRAATAHDLCTYQTIRYGSPHGVQLTKLPAVVEASTWISRQKAAKAFLASIGSDNDIQGIMGARYTDVKFALEGTRSFGSAPATTSVAPTATKTTTAAAATVSATTDVLQNSTQNLNPCLATAQPVPSSSNSVPVRQPAVTNAAPAKLAGTKRKTQPKTQFKAHLGTIDLTGENSS